VLDRALRDGALAHRLVRHLTLGKTHFPRCAPHIEALAHHLDRPLAAMGPEEKAVVLSAGYAKGGEHYSVAIAAESLAQASASR
jgi:chemotaxis methyl-accepting protein methylase